MDRYGQFSQPFTVSFFMELGEKALMKLEAHERECLVRYEAIQDTLNKHHDRFDKLEQDAKNGFEKIERYLVWGVGLLATLITLFMGVAEFFR